MRAGRRSPAVALLLLLLAFVAAAPEEVLTLDPGGGGVGAPAAAVGGGGVGGGAVEEGGGGGGRAGGGRGEGGGRGGGGGGEGGGRATDVTPPSDGDGRFTQEAAVADADATTLTESQLGGMGTEEPSTVAVAPGALYRPVGPGGCSSPRHKMDAVNSTEEGSKCVLMTRRETSGRPYRLAPADPRRAPCHAAPGATAHRLAALQVVTRTMNNRPISVHRFPRRALTLCPQLCMGIQPGARFPARSADALPATLYGDLYMCPSYGDVTHAIYQNRPIARHVINTDFETSFLELDGII